MGTTKCFWCLKEFDDSFSFCPCCGKEKGSIEGMNFADTQEIEKIVKENVIKYRGKMQKHDKLLDLIEERNKDILERQKDVTDRFLNRFPQIRDKIEEKHEVKFYLFVVSVPYMGEEKYQHECILQRLAQKHSGIVNLSLNMEEISSNLYSVEIPIWTDVFSEIEIEKQYNILRKEMPYGQNLFIHSIEPWYYLDRIYEFDGRWIDWKFVFEIQPEKLEKYVKENEEVPVNFQSFSSMRYSNILSTAGTATDGETLIGIIEEDEREVFHERYGQLEKLYSKGSPPGLEFIEISWDTLKELGFLYQSVDKIFRSKTHIFSRSLGDLLINMSEEEFVRLTNSVNFRKGLDDQKLSEIIVDHMCDRIYKTYGDSTIEVHEPIQRGVRHQYRISGGAHGR